MRQSLHVLNLVGLGVSRDAMVVESLTAIWDTPGYETIFMY
jgi:hypothetical protein